MADWWLNGDLESRIGTITGNMTVGEIDSNIFLSNLPVTPSFFLNPTDKSRMSLRRTAYFDGTSNSYLEAANHSDFDALTKFTISFWVNKGEWRIGQGETYISKAASAGNRTFWVGCGSGYKDQKNMEVYLYDASDTESAAKFEWAGSDDELPAFSGHVTVVYDGAGVANADRLKIYFDGVPQTLAFTGTIPATLKTSTAPIRLGVSDYQTAWKLKGTLSRVNFWNASLNQAAIDTLYANGEGISCRETWHHSDTSTGLVSAWELDEDGGQRRDLVSGHDFKTASGVDVGTRQLILRWDEVINGYQFTPARTTSRNVYYSRAPYLIESDTNTLSVQCDKSHKIHAFVEKPFPETSGELFQVLKFIKEGIPGTAESFPFMVGNTENATQYTGSMLSATLQNQWRYRDDGVGYNATATGSFDLTLLDVILNNWVGYGTGGSASFVNYVNGSAEAIETISANDLWFGDQTQQRTIALNCLSRSSGIDGSSSIHFGTTLVFSTTLTSSQRAVVNKVLNTKHSAY